MEYVIRCSIVIALMLGTTACMSSQRVSISSNPDKVSIQVDGRNIGTTPTNYDFSFSDEMTRHSITGTKDGYHAHTMSVTEQSLKRSSGAIQIVLESQNKTAFITSDPDAARVKINNEDVGQTPMNFSFNFSERNRRYAIEVSKSGFFDSTVVVGEKSQGIRSGTIKVVLEKDPAWLATSESEATNKWLRIAIDPSISFDAAWQKIIDSVTMRYDSLEQLDQASGYLRSSSQVREFPKGPDGPFVVRTQLLGSISSKEPLTYKIKLISKTRAKNDTGSAWKKFGRVFTEDAELVEELQNRLGLK